MCQISLRRAEENSSQISHFGPCLGPRACRRQGAQGTESLEPGNPSWLPEQPIS